VSGANAPIVSGGNRYYVFTTSGSITW
jgi:hypothetical protein